MATLSTRKIKSLKLPVRLSNKMAIPDQKRTHSYIVLGIFVEEHTTQNICVFIQNITETGPISDLYS